MVRTGLSLPGSGMLEREATMPSSLQSVAVPGLRLICRFVVVAIITTLTAVVPSSHDTPAHPLAAADQSRSQRAEIVLAIPVGQRGSISLPDGTDLVLNTSTRVLANVQEHSRDIVLEEGELLADVKEYSALPAVIHTSHFDLETTAAKLHIRIERSGMTTVDVLSGACLLRPNRSAHPVKVIAGQTALVGDETLIVTAFEPAQIARALAWQDGQIVLQGETLEEAVAEFNRYNRRKLVLADPALARARVGGRFEATDVDGFVSALQKTFSVRAVSVRSGGAGASVIVLMAAHQSAVT
jgi:ferric-dicitrate binding protein FerR (iron transport regulator)